MKSIDDFLSNEVVEMPRSINHTSVTLSGKINGKYAEVTFKINYRDITSRAFHTEHPDKHMYDIGEKIQGPIELFYKGLQDVITDTDNVKVKIKGYKIFKANLRVHEFSVNDIIGTYSNGALYVRR